MSIDTKGGWVKLTANQWRIDNTNSMVERLQRKQVDDNDDSE